MNGRRFSAIAAACWLPGLLLCAAPAAAGPYAFEFGEVSGQPGEVVEVPVRLTAEERVAAFVIPFTFDPARLEFIGYEIEGTEAEIFSPTSIFSNSFRAGEVFVGLLPTVIVGVVVALPPGERRLVGRLQMRIRAGAPPGVVPVRPVKQLDRVGVEINYLSGSVDILVVDSRLIDLLDGSVTVLPLRGPRPVGNLACSQFLDAVRITFTLTEAYDEIEVRRGGTTVATLPGTATELADPLRGAVGPIVYSVISRRGGESSIAVSCKVVALPPAAPAVRDLECSRDGIAWMNPVAYDGVFIFRDGDLIAALPGDAQSFVDPGRSDAQTVYTVIGELRGFRSPEVNCIDNGTWILEVGDVIAPVNAEVISIPILATTSLPVVGIGMALVIDKSRFEILPDQELFFEGTVSDPNPEIFLAGVGAADLPSVGIIWDAVPPTNLRKDLPVGLQQHFINFVFRPVVPFAAGESFEVSILPGEDNFTVSPKRTDILAIEPSVLIPGKIQFGSPGLNAVQDLAATVDPAAGGGQAAGMSDIRLTWKNTAGYERIRIERNGEPVAEIPGGETSFMDQDVEKGIYTYKVIGLSGQISSFPTRTLVSTFAPPGAFFRGDVTLDGEIDVSDPVATLEFLFLGSRALGCLDAADSDDNGEININDPVFTLGYLFLGGVAIKAPGKPFPWFDPSPDDLTCGGSVKK